MSVNENNIQSCGLKATALTLKKIVSRVLFFATFSDIDIFLVLL